MVFLKSSIWNCLSNRHFFGPVVFNALYFITNNISAHFCTNFAKQKLTDKHISRTNSGLNVSKKNQRTLLKQYVHF